MLVPPAGAADLPVKAPPAPADYDWTGFYIGGHVGLVTGQSGWTLAPLGGGVPVSGSFGLYQSPNAFKESGSWFEGVQGGYIYMLRNRVVLGIEADGSFPTFPDPVSGLTIGGMSQFHVADTSAPGPSARTCWRRAPCAAASAMHLATGCSMPPAASPGPTIMRR